MELNEQFLMFIRKERDFEQASYSRISQEESRDKSEELFQILRIM